MIIAAQSRAGRALIGWSIDRLSDVSGVSKRDISAFESGSRKIKPASVETLQRALEDGGAHFIAEGKTRGPGVRLKFSRLIVKRIDIWENEGGPAGEDDI
jgi:transcriptional regulator with XRE-family HTH domain